MDKTRAYEYSGTPKYRKGPMFHSAENAIQEAYKRAKARIAGGTPVQTDKYEGVAGDIKKNPIVQVTVRVAHNGVPVFCEGTTELSYVDAAAFFGQIDEMYVGAEHTDVKEKRSGEIFTSANPASCGS
jgi:hypothetical protein